MMEGVRAPFPWAFWLTLAPAVVGCADRPLDLPQGPPADAARARDLGAADLSAADLAVVADLSGALDFAVVSDLANVFDLAVAPDLAPQSDLARACGCGFGCPSLCALGQPCRGDTDCLSNACDSISSTCVADPCDDHHRDGRESDVDCGDGICRPCGGLLHCNDDTSCQSPQICIGPFFFALPSQCVGGRCSLSFCGLPPDACHNRVRDGNESDVDCGGGTCDACPHGKHCSGNGDCFPGNQCIGGLCLTAGCIPGVCGAACVACADGLSCSVADDCASRVCDPGSHTCAAPSCSDQIMNGNETGVDCGGGCPSCSCSNHVRDGDETDVDCGGSCPPCALTHICHGDADCQSHGCDTFTFSCVADPCADHRLDGTESDVDCGGLSCPSCPVGADCASDGDCGPYRCDPTRLVCAPPWCFDGRLDGSESDLDCGGACIGCPVGDACRVDQDCASHACDALTLRCVADPCADHWKEGPEISVDCGGSCSCASVPECQSDGDCVGLFCDLATHFCHDAWCSDGVADHGESDVDCGVDACGQCALGKKCNGDSDCLSYACDALSAVCIADHCQDHRLDSVESDVDCGGGCAGCAVGKKCRDNGDCTPGHACNFARICQ
jgi:hypothetical protein